MGVIDYSLYLKEILSQPAPEEERYGNKSRQMYATLFFLTIIVCAV